MKILVFMPYTNSVYEDDTSMHCRALETYGGHEILKVKHSVTDEKELISHMTDDVKNRLHEVDVIWCPYEDLLLHAIEYKEELNKPMVGHFEISLPGRVFLDTFDIQLAEGRTTEEIQKEYPHYYVYRLYLTKYLKCDVKTITGQYHKFRCEKIIGVPLGETMIKPYPFDSELYDKYKKDDVKEKYQVCSIYRPVMYKKTADNIKALAMLKNPPRYIVAGGDINHTHELIRLKKLVEELKVDVDFVGRITDEEKIKLLQESMFSFSHYGWLPPTEAAYLKKPCVAYYEPDTFERLYNIPLYVQANNIVALSRTIERLSNNPEERKKIGEQAHKMLINNDCHTHLLKSDNELLTKMFKVAIMKGKQND